MKKVFCTVLICASLMVLAQKGTISGNINDNSQIALPGAKITLSPGNIFTISDEHGNFVFLNVPPGNYTLNVDYIGYGKKEISIVVDPDKNIKQNIVFSRRRRIICV